jgi:hypothetical protein
VRPFLLHIFARVSRPWVEFLEEWVGFRPSANDVIGLDNKKVPRYFIGVEEEMVRIEGDGKAVQTLGDYYVLKREQVPGFLSLEEAVVVFETGVSLRYLRRTVPTHPLSHPGATATGDVGLEWRFGWEDLEK